MRSILVWSPNYAPEPTGIPPLVTDLAEALVDRNYSVDVVTAVPNYPDRVIHPEYRRALWRTELRQGVRVHRSWLRAKRETSLFDKALYEATISTFALPNAVKCARRADVIVCVVPTLLAALYAGCVARVWRKPLVLWVQDLVLNAGMAVVGQRAGRVLSMLRRFEAIAFRSADRIVVCSPGFVDYIAEAGVDRTRIDVVCNWADTEQIRLTPPPSNGHVAFLYAGNLGHTQGLETLIDAAKHLAESARVEIVGSGNASEEVRRAAAPVANVAVREPVPRAAYPDLLAGADVHVVIQRRVAAGANLPSKIATALASGRPVVASLDLDTPAAQMLRESGAALLVEPESSEALAAAMRRLADDRALRLELGRRGRAYAERHLGKDEAVDRLERALAAVSTQAPAAPREVVGHA